MNVKNKPDRVPVEKLTWNQTIGMIETLARKIKESKESFDYIYGIPRGGLIPAVILSHKLGIPLTINSPDGFFRTREGRYLVIDDISDTGQTFKSIVKKELMIATLHMRHNTKFKPNLFVKEIKDNTWIQYPWEED